MPQKLSVALLYGGKSGEHEVSLRSAACVFHNLNKEKYNVIPVAIDKDGMIFVHDPHEITSSMNALPVHLDSAIPAPSLIQNGRFFLDADCVFPIAHGPLYEDGSLQGILESVNIAYVGCDVLSSALGMDKDIARRIVCDENLRSARYDLVSWTMNAAQKSRILEEMADNCGFPLFVKPCSLGSSVGIQKINSLSAGMAAIDDALKYDKSVLIEEFILGKEIELAVLENRVLNQAPRCTLPGEIKVTHEDGFYSYNAKYIHSDKSELIIPADLPMHLTKDLQEAAVKVFIRLKCRGMARVDFFVQVETKSIFFNEINSIPGFTPISMYPKLWELDGLQYSSLLDELIELALTHHVSRLHRITSYV